MSERPQTVAVEPSSPNTPAPTNFQWMALIRRVWLQEPRTPNREPSGAGTFGNEGAPPERTRNDHATMEVTSRPSTRWKPGQTGNPKGRPPGQSETGKLRAAIGKQVTPIIKRLIELAKGGDVQAARLLLERVLPPVKPTEQPVSIDLAGLTLIEQGQAVIAAAGAGQLAPSQAAQMLSGLASVARLHEEGSLTERIAALEARNAKSS